MGISSSEAKTKLRYRMWCGDENIWPSVKMCLEQKSEVKSNRLGIRRGFKVKRVVEHKKEEVKIILVKSIEKRRFHYYPN